MTDDHSHLLDELALFADIGTDPPLSATSGRGIVVRMTREGEEVELLFGSSGRITERWHEGPPRTHSSYRALLASERFGGLRRWADVQADVLRGSLGDPAHLIAVHGTLSAGPPDRGVEEIDDFLCQHKRDVNDAIHVLLIDGPAGIGKTNFIEQLALRRALGFKSTGRPLLLHVQSRGRVLSFIQDLMAYSLQTLRLQVTYDQIPILVRHGLITLAIDGFDELGDPNGYDLAWAQVSELVDDVRGLGTLILAGRETFIGRDRILRDVKSLSEPRDTVHSLTLRLPEPTAAKSWLRARGWSDQQLQDVGELFEPTSYALRPFFLAQLAHPETAERLRSEKVGNPYLDLIDAMIFREASKFGEAVEAVMSLEQRLNFVRTFLREVARDLADTQSESIDESSLAWLVEAALGDDCPRDLVAILKNRAAVMAFLTTDDRPRRRRFAHSQLQNSFLAQETIDAVRRSEIPKYLRRNIFGADFLVSFGDVVVREADVNPKRAASFIQAALEASEEYLYSDRGSRNLGALLLAALPVADMVEEFRVEALHVDDAVVQGTALPAIITNLSISQLDVRDADLSQVIFNATSIVSLIASLGTKISSTFPDPIVIQDATHGTLISEPSLVKQYMESIGRVSLEGRVMAPDMSINDLREHRLYRLLEKVCRVRQYWIRDDSDDRASRLISDVCWPELIDLLRRHDLVREEVRGAAGKSSTFYHVKKTTSILTRDENDEQVRMFLQDIDRKIREAARRTVED